MDLMEYKAKELFAAHGIPTGRGVTVDSPDALDGVIGELSFPAVVKAQAPVGGRGKAGGIRFAADPAELRAQCEAILGMDIRGHAVDRVYVTGRLDYTAEWYLAIALDRTAKRPVILFSPDGGVDIEETARLRPERIVKLPVDPLLGVRDYAARYLLGKTGAQGPLEPFAGILSKLYDVFVARDCTLAEINPLVLTPEGGFVALDAKITVDDNALPRQSEVTAYRDGLREDPLTVEARSFRFLYIPCDAAGSVAVMSNGSGMIMSCIDSLAARGMRVRAALDLGGGATADRIAQAVRILLSDPGVRALFVNIFGGITRCDEVAGGVRDAMAARPGETRPVIIRFEGTHKQAGIAMLREIPGVRYVEGLAGGVAALYERRAEL